MQQAKQPPVPVIIGHGAFAAVTLLLVLLSAAGVS